MTQQEKQLLLVDLCARLPYGVNVKCPSDDEPYTLLSINWNKEIVVIGFVIDEMYVTSKQKLVDIKPYLRPMSSMTEDEIIEFNNIPSTKNYTIIENDLPWDVAHYKQIDWLNKKMFDFRGLIPKDLALSTIEFNPYEV